MIIISILFLIWKKNKRIAPKVAKHPINGVGQKVTPNMDTGEDFINYVAPIRADWRPSFPAWTTDSIVFLNTAHDSAYDDYHTQNNAPSAELLAQIASAPIHIQPTMPDYGAELGTFDSGDISHIPWDADNTSYIQSDIVWGHVSRQASTSIFSKVYHRNLVADSANLVETDTTFQYHSPVLNITTNDAVTSALLQTSDAVVSVLGQSAISSLSSRLSDKVKNAQMRYDASVADRLDAKEKGGVELTRDENRIRTKARTSSNTRLEDLKLKDRESKISRKINLTPTELLEQAQHEMKHPQKLTLASKFTKRLESLSIVTKFKAGIAAAKRIAIDIAKKVGQKLANTLGISMGKMWFAHTITALLTVAEAEADIATAATLGAASPIAAVITAISKAWMILDIICMAVMIGLQIMLPALESKVMDVGGICPSGGKPLDQLINDDALYFIFTTFIPIGGVFDAFGPYLCFSPDGSTHMKEALYIPPYFSDSTLSLYRHVYSADETPRGDKSSYTDPLESMPPGWTYTAGIARSPCDPGTWTSSDVDMLCNISTYVPLTYVKASHVPFTGVKDSHINETKPKTTSLQVHAKRSYGRGAGRLPDKGSCPNGWRDDFTSCWEDLQC